MSVVDAPGTIVKRLRQPGDPPAPRMHPRRDVVTDIARDLRRLPSATTPSVREVRRRYSKVLAPESPRVIVAIVRSLLAGAGWAERVVAFELLAGHPESMRQLRGPVVEELARGLSDWGSVDLFGVTVAGVAWRDGRVSDRQVLRWARSRDRWRRRLALVATVPLNSKARGGTGDAARTLAMCRMLADDRDDMVVKAMSWALRELAKRDRDSVAAFLREEEGRLASRIRREVTTKLETGRKSRKRS